MKAKLNKTHIEKYRQIAGRIDNTRLKPFVQDANYIDMQKVLCDEFYFNVMNNAENHVDLFQGCSYEVDGVTRYHEGLNSVWALFTYARFVRFGSAVSTAYDMVVKQNDNSTSVSEKEKQIMYTENRKVAMSYWQNVRKYLELTDYDGWNVCCEQPKMTEWKSTIIQKK